MAIQSIKLGSHPAVVVIDPWHHLYLVAVYDDGRTEQIEAGPEIAFPTYGAIEYQPTLIEDFPGGAGEDDGYEFAVDVPFSGNLDTTWALLRQFGTDLHLVWDYDIVSRNSNTFIASLLSFFGIDIESLIPSNALDEDGNPWTPGIETRIGGALDNVLYGDKQDNYVYGGGGNDSLHGGKGADVIVGDGANRSDGPSQTPGSDVINGDEGNDILYGGFEADFLFGGTDVDKISGGTGGDYIDGGSEDDIIYGDVFRFEEDDGLSLWESQDPIDGEPTKGGNDTIIGGDGSDLLVGGVGVDSLEGGIGADILYGDGDKETSESPGADILKGGAGRDVLIGGDGNDKLYGNDDNEVDFLVGDDGANIFYAGKYDILVAATEEDSIYFGDILFDGGNARFIRDEDGMPSYAGYAVGSEGEFYVGIWAGTLLILPDFGGAAFLFNGDLALGSAVFDDTDTTVPEFEVNAVARDEIGDAIGNLITNWGWEFDPGTGFASTGPQPAPSAASWYAAADNFPLDAA